jgi:hypothetical protein
MRGKNMNSKDFQIEKVFKTLLIVCGGLLFGIILRQIFFAKDDNKIAMQKTVKVLKKSLEFKGMVDIGDGGGWHPMNDYYVAFDVSRNNEFDGILDGEIKIREKLFSNIDTGQVLTLSFNANRKDTINFSQRHIKYVNGMDLPEFFAQSKKKQLEQYESAQYEREQEMLREREERIRLRNEKRLTKIREKYQ